MENDASGVVPAAAARVEEAVEKKQKGNEEMHQKKKKRKMGTEQSPEMEVATFVPKQGNAVK